MKRKILLFNLLMLFSVSFAQSRLGGDFGFGIQANTSDNGCSLNFNIELKYTYAINDKWEIGGSVTLGTWQTIYNSRKSNFVYALNPLVRFLVVGNERIGFWLDGKVTIGASTTRVINNYGRMSGSGMDLHWGINVNPVLTYQITDKLRLDATFGLLGIGLNGITHLDGGATNTTIDFGAHLSNGSLTNVIDHVNTIVDYGSSSNPPFAQGRFLAKMVDFQIGFVYAFSGEKKVKEKKNSDKEGTFISKTSSPTNTQSNVVEDKNDPKDKQDSIAEKKKEEIDFDKEIENLVYSDRLLRKAKKGEYVAAFDLNQDGEIETIELNIVATFAAQCDLNGDGFIGKSEQQELRNRLKQVAEDFKAQK